MKKETLESQAQRFSSHSATLEYGSGSEKRGPLVTRASSPSPSHDPEPPSPWTSSLNSAGRKMSCKAGATPARRPSMQENLWQERTRAKCKSSRPSPRAAGLEYGRLQISRVGANVEMASRVLEVGCQGFARQSQHQEVNSSECAALFSDLPNSARNITPKPLHE